MRIYKKINLGGGVYASFGKKDVKALGNFFKYIIIGPFILIYYIFKYTTILLFN